MNSSRTIQIRDKAKHFGQEHIFRFWDELNDKSRRNLLEQVENIDFELMENLRNDYIINRTINHFSGELEPAPIITIPTTNTQMDKAKQAKAEGEKLLSSGKVAALLVAGGQGTRLGFDGPKGKYPAGPISSKSLFQMHAEKILALNRKYNTTIPWFIMTSEANHDETVNYFSDNKYFGLNQADIYFFTQGMIPAMDEKGLFFLEKKDHIFCNPNGHGGTLYALRDNDCLAEMKRRGIEEIFYFQVDNTLINICDPCFIGYHHLSNAEMSSKVVAKEDPHEKVGVIGKLNGKIAVIEYSDLPKDAMEARNADGKLKYIGGSIAIHMIKRAFVEQMTAGDFSLPYHVANKKINFIDENGNYVQPEKPNGFKLEMFIFDALPYTKNSVVMEIVREDEFSPIKNAEGQDSPQTAKQDLMNYYGRMMKQAGFEVDFDENGNLKGLLEISPLFALDAEELKEKLDKNFRFEGNLILE
ncbi:hypothetical protein B6I21_03055 [candidate division KSB1 bacterium 4572_119]|nr:MAG: hypothetical protein B6I21_03055 [candidate division KSB1 bacterium 4572_119]